MRRGCGENAPVQSRQRAGRGGNGPTQPIRYDDSAVKLPFPLQPGEQVALVTRRHWIFFVPRFVADALAGIVPVAALLIGFAAAGTLKGTALRIALIVCALWLLFWLFRIALLKYRYDRDLWAVTDQRVVDVVQRSPFDFHMASTDLVRIQDMAIAIDGVFQRMLDYGDIECQTAGEAMHFTFRGVPNPKAIAAVVERESLRAKGYGPPPQQDARTEPLQRP